MNKSIRFIYIAIMALLAISSLKAQNSIATLQHNGTVNVFQGLDALKQSYQAAVPGDTINLSAGFFNSPDEIAKGLTIVGSGHFPDSINQPRTTFLIVNGAVNLVQGANNLRLEGLYFMGDINFQAVPMNYISIVRCHVKTIIGGSWDETNRKDNILISECFVDMDNNWESIRVFYGDNIEIRHNVLKAKLISIIGANLIEGNIFLCQGCFSFQQVSNAQIENNVILATNYPIESCTGNSFSNNLFVGSNFSIGNNSFVNNYTNVDVSEIFVNYTVSGAPSYTDNYHLKHPELYIGTDGKEVGLYGGVIPFKDGGYPFNPIIVKRLVAPQTSLDGGLQIEFKVKAQSN